MPAQASLFDVGPQPGAASWVYLIGVPGKAIAKIGRAQDVSKRLASLQTSHHERLSVLWRTRGGRELEKKLHEFFGAIRLTGEWFDFGGEDPVGAVESAVRELGQPIADLPPVDDEGPADPSPEVEKKGIPYSLYPADDDPDRDDPAYAPFHLPAGCRYLTPTENASWGNPPDDEVFWYRCRDLLGAH